MSIEAPERPDIIDDLEKQFAEPADRTASPLAPEKKAGGLGFIPNEVTVGVRGLSNYLDFGRRRTYRLPIGRVAFIKPDIPPTQQEYERLINQRG